MSDPRADDPPADSSDDDFVLTLARDVVTAVAVVAVVAALLFAVSGVWPPFVAIESGSMEPNAEIGDLVFVVDEERFAGDGAIGDTGVVTLEDEQEGGHETFGEPGDVVIFAPNGDPAETPIIHRAHFWVEEGENWVETSANDEYLNGNDCEDLAACPASHDGFVTKGDANGAYDQAVEYQYGDTNVVAPDWILGKASFRIPWLGHVRLLFESLLAGVGALTAVGVGWSIRR
ncbi:S26 family signal peptidase [Natronobacterium texcoconense]|uniref:Signal peptidase, endoplasmic reticulum-type n=1 Tax=Natronobacterium texcoconense TaxID=1095778 RepID=A0A1H1HX16_NATTX|nr:S26 family signal peptidase [Natronobacterium texcoconense]SDR29963.1 signal peptidase, endoplasmic reticulum-type [Natronobacterium texcoconense]